MQKAKKVLNHFGYNESQFDISDVYTGHRKKTVNEIFEKIALANLLGSDKKVRVTIEYDPNYEISYYLLRTLKVCAAERWGEDVKNEYNDKS